VDLHPSGAAPPGTPHLPPFVECHDLERGQACLPDHEVLEVFLIVENEFYLAAQRRFREALPCSLRLNCE
jgi:hypothetical protein